MTGRRKLRNTPAPPGPSASSQRKGRSQRHPPQSDPDDSEEEAAPRRSTRAQVATDSEKLDLILLELRGLSSRITKVETSVDKVESDLFEANTRIDGLVEALEETESKLEQAFDEIDRLENFQRENSGRLRGIEEGAEDAVAGSNCPVPFLIDFFKENCGVELKPKHFQKAHRLGTFRADQRYPRDIIFKMRDYQRKCDIFAAAKTSLTDGKYRVMPDLSDRLRRRRAAFWPLREQIHAMDLKSYFKGKLSTLHIEAGDTTYQFPTMAAAKKGLRLKFPDLVWKRSTR